MQSRTTHTVVGNWVAIYSQFRIEFHRIRSDDAMELAQYLPSPVNVIHLALAIFTVAGLAVIGGALTGRKRDPSFDIFCGFGVVTGLMTVLGVLTNIPFSWMAISFWISVPLSLLLVWRRDTSPNGQSLQLGLIAKILVLALPILISVSAMQASQWDEFSQWLFNSLYIWKFDSFPQAGLPRSPSVFPAYPHGNQLFSYLVSYASGTFVEMGVAFANILLLLALAPVYVSMIGFGCETSINQTKSWFAAAVGILGVTILSTTFVQKLVFTAYADTATGVLMGVLGILLWRLLNDLSGKSIHARSLAWQFALASMFFINIKQTNLVLLGLMLLAGIAIALRDNDISLFKYLRYLLVMLAPPLIVYFSWRFHVSENLSGREFSLKSTDLWLIEEAFVILARMFLIASKKGAYFGMMFAISIAGFWCFISGRGGSYGRLLFISGAIFTGYWLFLWTMYIAAFTEYEGTRAASFWRYNVQLGLLGALTAAVTLGKLYKSWFSSHLVARPFLRRGLSTLIIFGVFVAPLAFNHKIRIDIRPQIQHMRFVGKELARVIPSGSTLAVLDPRGQGLADLIIKYEVLSFSRFATPPKFASWVGSVPSSLESLKRRLKEFNVSHIWVHQKTDWYAAGLGLRGIRDGGSTLISKSVDGTWRIEKFWPYLGYTDPYSLPD
tara:strand:+ start:673 stop:2676 length:2004 start_codon:yes stop_codon:yes gene_type:complete